MILLAAGLLAVAVVLWMPVSAQHRLVARAPARRTSRRLRLVPALVIGTSGCAVLGWLLDDFRGLVLGLAAGTIVAVTLWVTAHHRAALRRSRMRADLVRWSGQLAALLRSGHSAGRALDVVARAVPALAEPVAAHRAGAPLPEALRTMSGRDGLEGLAVVAAAWQLAERTGASMTDALDGVAEQLESEREVSRTVEAELAAPRLTGRLLGLLPLVGLALGYAVGGDPVDFLVNAPVGRVCLAVGVLLAAVGVVWNEWLADRAGAGP